MDFAQQLKSQIDIVDVVSEKVRLKRVGASPRYMGLCPFHTEKTGSFSVHQGLQIYKCFGCGVFGDVFKFVMEMENITFYETLTLLAERYGIPMPKRTDMADRDSRLREAVYRMHEIALAHFRSLLLSAQGADSRQYLAGRGVSMEIAEQFGLGLSDRGNTLTQKLQREGFPTDVLEDSGLIMRRQEGGGFFDRFRGRLMFTIHNESGKVVGFAGRAMAKGDEPKYMNSPETCIYKKSHLLYNLHRAKDAARKNGRFVLVEGYMDVIGLASAGIQESVASCGTSLTSGQVKLMKRFADQVTVNFDPDAAGARGAEKSLQALLDEHARVRVLELDKDLDPDEYIKQFGVELYQQLLQRAPNYYFWLADQARKRFDHRTAEGRMQALQFLLPAIQRIPDKIERAGVAGDLAAYLGVERGLVLEQFKKAALDKREYRLQQPAVAVKSVERILLSAALLHPDLREELMPRLAAAPGVSEFRSYAIFQAMIALYGNLPAFAYSDLDARLDESARDLLSRLVFADEQHEADNLEDVRKDAMSCLQTLEKGEREARMTQLRQEIAEAQRRDDQQRVMELAAELDRLKPVKQIRRNPNAKM
ncbi:MAG: DNA primase [Acidobacteria bacterium]|nr:DNA primase [Acidobacteriota bacterium]